MRIHGCLAVKMSVQETTPHELALPQKVGSTKRQREEIQEINFQNAPSAKVLRGFLSPEECQTIVEQAHSFGMEGCSSAFRQVNRVAAKSTDVAKMLFERAKPFLDAPSLHLRAGSTAIPEGIKPSANLESGVWTASSINEVFRICRYEAGDFFFPHYDEAFQRSKYEQSFQTIMVYLNDGDFEGGATRFYDDSQKHYCKGDPSKVIESFRPRMGDTIIFYSQLTHDGEPLTSGEKYILRSEIMYSLDERDRRPKYESDHADDIPPELW